MKAHKFNQFEGKVESKYELFKTVCKGIQDDIKAISKVPPCNIDVLSKKAFDSFIKDALLDDQYFELVAILNESAYQGYFKMMLDSNIPFFPKCYKLIDRRISKSFSFPDITPDFCR